MKLILNVVFAVACLTLAAAAFVEEDFTLVEGPTSAPINEGDVTEIVFAEEEPTTKKVATMRVPSTTTAKPVAVVDAVVEAAPVATTPRTRKSSSRTRVSGSNRRKQQSKSKVAEPAVEEENAKAESTSPASVDTASVAILAPKNFKPTPRPLNEFQETQGLMEFLKKRKMERIQASTTPDPFASILATATAPSTEESVTVAIENSPVRSNSGSSRRLPTTNRRFGNNNPRSTTTTTTTAAPTTEATTVAAVTSRRNSPNRFGASRNKAPTATIATTTAQPVTEEPKPVAELSARSKLFPKRPANLRPIGNSISRRKDQASTTEAPVPVVVATEEEVVGIPEVIEEVIVEPTTAAPLRRTRGRLAARLSGF